MKLEIIPKVKGQSFEEALTEAGYPGCEVGVSRHSSPKPGRMQVAWLRVGRYGVPLPVFGTVEPGI